MSSEGAGSVCIGFRGLGRKLGNSEESTLAPVRNEPSASLALSVRKLWFAWTNPAKFQGISIPEYLSSTATANLSCKPPSGGIGVQNCPHDPVYPAGFASYIITSGGMNNLPPFIGSANIVLEGVSLMPAGPPHTYLGVSQTLLKGIPPLAAAGIEASVALAFVAAQTTECALKGYLSRNGDDRRLKERSLRHNLEALWNLAYSEDLPISAQPPEWLRTLSGLHNAPYYVRYSTGVNGLVTPIAEPMAAELKLLVELVAKHI